MEEKHIGSSIKKVLKDRNMRVVDFAKAINTTRGNVYSIFKRRGLNTELLTKVSKTLCHDFTSEFETYQSKKRILVIGVKDDDSFERINKDPTIEVIGSWEVLR